jgi:hypothetical protein
MGNRFPDLFAPLSRIRFLGSAETGHFFVPDQKNQTAFNFRNDAIVPRHRVLEPQFYSGWAPLRMGRNRPTADTSRADPNGLVWPTPVREVPERDDGITAVRRLSTHRAGPDQIRHKLAGA